MLTSARLVVLDLGLPDMDGVDVIKALRPRRTRRTPHADRSGGASHSSKTNHPRVYMARLRRKLETDPSHPRHLVTEPGMGCRFET